MHEETNCSALQPAKLVFDNLKQQIKFSWPMLELRFEDDDEE